MKTLADDAINLLKDLISTPSITTEESDTADIIEAFLNEKDISTERHLNNAWAVNKHFDASKPTLLLNSHHDTVKPNSGYTNDPFTPIEKGGKLFGLGSNDAGGPLTSLIATFFHFYERDDLGYNLLLVASAEEEISGKNGLSSVIDKIPKIDCAIVGEPTRMRMAVAEKGLIVLHCRAQGKSGHAARGEGENAIYKALDDISWFRNYHFEKVSDMLGPVKMTVTIIKAGSQHNVVPDSCSFTVDVRNTDAYSNKEVLDFIDENIASEITRNSIRLKPSFIPLDHPLVKAGEKLGIKHYGSPTMSDQANLSVPSLKMGPGKSARSHTADEFIYQREIEEGIERYINLLELFIC